MDGHIVRESVESTAALVALTRLFYVRLTKQYQALAWYLGLLCVSNVLAGVLATRSKTYFWFYVALIPLESATAIFAIRELIALIFANYPGIRTVGRWALYAGTGLSVVASIALTKLFFYSGSTPRRRWILFYVETGQRSITLTLAIAIIAIVVVLSKYPLHLGRNTLLYCAFFSAIFLIQAAQLLADTSQRLLFNETAETAAVMSVSGCLFAWALLLRAQTASAPRIVVSTAHEDRLLHQLESLNSLMIRAARR